MHISSKAKRFFNGKSHFHKLSGLLEVYVRIEMSIDNELSL